MRTHNKKSMLVDDRINFPIAKIIDNFCLEGKPKSVVPYISGHINDTYLIVNEDSFSPDYLLQRVNHHIFKDVPALIHNIYIVTTHLRKKLQSRVNGDLQKEVLQLIGAQDGRFYYKDDFGNFWRCYIYIANTNSYNVVTTEKQAYQGGLAFGRFQALLSDLDINLLTETIPDFHNIVKRLERFDNSVLTNPQHRVLSVWPEIEFIRERANRMTAIFRLGEAGKLPARITHNDTKFSNVLLTQDDEAQCVVDLDTVMAGYVAYDFGDAIRTSVNTSCEDEKDLEKIDVNIPLFAAYTSGYLKEAHSFLTKDEINSLFEGVLLLPYMQAVRFLTDYIEGDHYFKIDFRDHNLQRTRAQLRLLSRLEKYSKQLKGIIAATAEEYSLKLSTREKC